MKTVRRDFLWRACKLGRLVLVAGYTFDDQYGAERTAEEMPCLPNPESVHDRRAGIAYFSTHDFKSGSGCAWENENGTYTLHVHSNANYTFKIVEELK